jgi:hypothetical protein
MELVYCRRLKAEGGRGKADAENGKPGKPRMWKPTMLAVLATQLLVYQRVTRYKMREILAA